MGTSVDGILGASCDFWDEDEKDADGLPIIRVEEQEWLEISAPAHARGSGTRVVKWRRTFVPTTAGVYVDSEVFMSVRATTALCSARQG